MNREEFVRKITNFIETNNLIEKGDCIVAGVSGGADSVCLFKMLTILREKYDLTLKVVCMNHGLRKEAAEEVRYVKELCSDANVSFAEKNADVAAYAAEHSLGTEEAGRILRYDFFEEEALEFENRNVKIAVAHNKNDVSETLLFNLFRGTGLKGLASIRAKRDRIIRPLLCVERAEIEEFLRLEGLKYYTDGSNLTDEYSRNRIRHHILKYASEEINDGAVSHVAEAAGLSGELYDYIEKQANKALEKIIVSKSDREIILKRQGISEEDVYLSKVLIKKCIDMLVVNNKDITSRHLEQVRNIASIKMMGRTNLPYDISVTATQDLIRFLRGKENDTNETFEITGPRGLIEIPGVGRISWEVKDRKEDFVLFEKQYTKCFDYDKITECLKLRTLEKGDFLTVNAALQKKKLSDYFINEKVPSFERDKKILLADGSHIWWVVGMRISEYPKITEETKRILYITLE